MKQNKVYQHWDPLNTCIVGQAYPPEFYSWITHAPTRNKFEKMAEETEQDFQQLIKCLQKLNVQVLRPSISSDFEQYFINGEWTPPPVQPRDYAIQIHDRLWVCTVPNLDGAQRLFKQQDTLSWEQFQKVDQDRHDSKLSFYQDIFAQCNIQHTEHSYVSGCFITRLGKDLIVATQDVHTDQSALQLELDALFPDTDNHIADLRGHGDACYCPIKPGLIVSGYDPEEYVDLFPDWEVVYLPDSEYYNKFTASMKLNAGRWYMPDFDKHTETLEVVNNYFDHWVGDAQETIFGVNILVVDQNNIILNDYNSVLEQACKKHNINMHVIPFKHKYFWDAGTHCLTNDLNRTGTLGKHI